MEEYRKHIPTLSNSDLIKMLNSENEYRPEAIAVAKEEIEKRGGIERVAESAIKDAESTVTNDQEQEVIKSKPSPLKSGCATVFLIFICVAIFQGYLRGSNEKEKAQVHHNDLQVAITREDTCGLKESQLNDLSIVKALENKSAIEIEKRCRNAYTANGNTEPIEINAESESWSVNVDGRSFVVVRVSVNNTIQSTAIMGIQEDTFIRISGFKNGRDPVPHASGELANKVKEIFGVDLMKYNK